MIGKKLSGGIIKMKRKAKVLILFLIIQDFITFYFL